VTVEVTDDRAHDRFVLQEDGFEAELLYRRHGERLELIHTGVPDELGGRGIGGRLVTAAVDRARAEGWTLVPFCPFARGWLQRHPDVASTVEINWPSGPGPAIP
jgi:uncharacterized protein